MNLNFASKFPLVRFKVNLLLLTELLIFTQKFRYLFFQNIFGLNYPFHLGANSGLVKTNAKFRY
ncbi:hypothetical protein D1BOALGB6SA_3179 [Olavius sp. associated proteobacterium Delta 1]|nr:hypothetical protein D1BOALGB6SA_3179 [Olavius sp. associated proteobacterium Delta 1]